MTSAGVSTGMTLVGRQDPRPEERPSAQISPPADLTQTQRGWLAKGIRSWVSYVEETAAPRFLGEVRRQAPYVDLNAYLCSRYQEANRKRAKWGRGGLKADLLWEWLAYFDRVILPRLAAGFEATALSREVQAVFAAPPGWTTAARFRVVLESSIRGILERLAVAIAPNAPSRVDPPKGPQWINAGAVPT
ncbi:MAG TPA: hypothetical protein VHR18_03575 [Solirubrobacterales bacterium]|jgi:hypothetical protein|nr:hypothetical protein [Solirubrobacterales bacterium]